MLTTLFMQLQQQVLVPSLSMRTRSHPLCHAYWHSASPPPWSHNCNIGRLLTLERKQLNQGGFGTLHLMLLKIMGRWSSDSFTLYLYKHAVILAPYV